MSSDDEIATKEHKETQRVGPSLFEFFVILAFFVAIE